MTSKKAIHPKQANLIGTKSLVDLRTITPDPVRKCPALLLQLLILLQLDALLPRHNRNRIPIHAPRIPVKQHLERLLDRLGSLLPRYLLHPLLILHYLPQQRLRQVRTISRRQRGRRESSAEQVDGAEKGRAGGVEAGDQDGVPERIDVGAALVHYFGKVGVQVARVEHVAGRAVVFVNVEGVEHAVYVLHVGDVAADAEDGGGVENAEALDVGEAGEGAVGC